MTKYVDHWCVECGLREKERVGDMLLWFYRKRNGDLVCAACLMDTPDKELSVRAQRIKHVREKELLNDLPKLSSGDQGWVGDSPYYEGNTRWRLASHGGSAVSRIFGRL